MVFVAIIALLEHKMSYFPFPPICMEASVLQLCEEPRAPGVLVVSIWSF